MCHSNLGVLQNIFKILKTDPKRFSILFRTLVVEIQVMPMMIIVCVFHFM